MKDLLTLARTIFVIPFIVIASYIQIMVALAQIAWDVVKWFGSLFTPEKWK